MMPVIKLTAQQALQEIAALVSTTEHNVWPEIKMIIACVTDEEEKSKLRQHPFIRNSRMKVLP